MVSSPQRWECFVDADRVEVGPLRRERGVQARRRGEVEEADLVVGQVQGTHGADAGAGARQLRGGRAGSRLARAPLAAVSSGEVRLDEVGRHR